MLKSRSTAAVLSAALFGALSISSAAPAQDASPMLQVAQATAPADDNIRVVVADLDRYEKQVAGLHSGQTGSAKRILKLLKQSEERLNTSPNTGHTSWTEANARLQALKGNIDKWLAQQ